MRENLIRSIGYIVAAQHVGNRMLFTEVTAPDPVILPFQSKTDGARLLSESFQLEPGRTLLVGDGKDDARTAEACGFTFIAVDYGYGSAAVDPDLAKLATLQTFSEIEHIVLTQEDFIL